MFLYQIIVDVRVFSGIVYEPRKTPLTLLAALTILEDGPAVSLIADPLLEGVASRR